MQRRDFLALAAASAALSYARPLKVIGAQLYTVRGILPKEPLETLRAIEKIGYREVEVTADNMDLICFLDVGGGASADKVRDALDMVLQDPKVRGIFINIFGGITRCDEVAHGIIAARDVLKITKPLVVRMTGTSEEEGRRLLLAAGITPGVSATEAAEKIVALTKESN